MNKALAPLGLGAAIPLGFKTAWAWPLVLVKIRVPCEQPPKYTPERVVSIRTKTAKMSQVAFASFLNVSVSTVQGWESPATNKHPSGAAAKLLQLVEAKGVNALIA